MRKHRRPNPLQELIMTMRSAAYHIDEPVFRRMSARAADRIPVTLLEKRFCRKGDFLKMGRRTLRELPNMDAEQLLEAQALLRGIVDAVEGRFELISETWLGQRRRREHYAAA